MFEQKRHAGVRCGGRAVLPLALLAWLVTATGPSLGATFPAKAAIAALSSAVGQAGSPCREQIDGWRILVDPEEHGMTTGQMADVLRRAGIRDFYALKGGAEAGQMGLGFFRGKRNADSRVAALKDLGFDARSEPFTATVPRADCNDTGAVATSSPPAAPSSAGDATAAGTGRAPEAAPGTPEPDSEAAEASPLSPSPSREPALAGRAGAKDAAGVDRETAASGCAGRGDSFIVLADPKDNGADVLVLVYKLRAAGIGDLFVVTTEPNKGQVSLGIFDTREQAEARVDELTELGFRVRSEARVGQNAGNCVDSEP